MIIRQQNLLLPQGAIINGNLNEIHPVNHRDPNEIQEFVTHSWYKYPDETKGLHPWDGITDPHYELGPNTKGTRTNIESLDEGGKYSWIKSPRWKGNAMEVGPLARWTVGYAQNKAEFKEPVDKLLKDLGLPLNALFSTLGRTAARALESQWAGYKMRHFQNKLIANIKNGDSSTANVDKWDPKTWPSEVKGVGFTEAPRGALAHWIKIKDGKIDNYQCGRADHLERQPARSQGQYRRLRGLAHGHAHGRSESAARDPAHAAFLRSLPRLLDPCDERGRPGNDQGSGALR